MEKLHELKMMLCKELEEYGRQRELPPSALDRVHKLTDTVKNIDKIIMLEEYEESDEAYEPGGMGVSGRRGMHYVRGHYSREGGSYDGGDSYAGTYRDRGRYETRDSGKEHMKREMREMMETAPTEREREAIRRWMEMLDKD